jgi:hypothetical protein
VSNVKTSRGVADDVLISPFFLISGFSKGTVTEMVEILLSRCVQESDPDARILVATCFGEVGAIAGHRLEETMLAASQGGDSDDTYAWRLSKPPWQSRPARYELQLVTSDLVVALKAAPTSAEQHKIAYTIQQLLVLLDNSVHESSVADQSTFCRQNPVAGNSVDQSKQEMTSWLSTKLFEAGVLDIVEPFWFSEFHEVSKIGMLRSSGKAIGCTHNSSRLDHAG